MSSLGFARLRLLGEINLGDSNLEISNIQAKKESSLTAKENHWTV
jgi:hypothetical protein